MNLFMKRLFLFLIICFTPFCAISQNSSDGGSSISGKPIVNIFANYSIGVNEGSDGAAAGFGIERAFLGYEAHLLSEFSVRVVYDMGTTGVDGSNLERVGYLRNAFVSWRRGRLKIDFGVINTHEFRVQRSFWGYRYVLKTYLNLYNYASASDVGVAASYKFNDWLDVDVSILNGEGYKKINTNQFNRYGIGVTVLPLKNIIVRLFYDNYNLSSLDNRETFALFVGYENRYFSLGVENNLINQKALVDSELYGWSVYTTIKLMQKVKLFARYDDAINHTRSLFVFGGEYKINRYLKFAPNMQIWGSEEGNNSAYMLVNIEFRL